MNTTTSTIKAASGSGYWYTLPGTKGQLWAATRAEAERAIKAAVEPQHGGQHQGLKVLQGGQHGDTE